MKESLQLAFYKGVGGKYGALQFQPQQPHYYCDDCKKKVYEPGKLPATGCPSGNCKNHGSEKRMKTREGCVFVEVANTTAPNKYNWDNKTTIALSNNDMSTLMLVLEGGQPGSEAKIMHDPGAKSPNAGKVSKNLSVSSPQGVLKGGVFVNIRYKAGKDERKYMVPLNPSETKRLAICMRQAIISSVNW